MAKLLTFRNFYKEIDVIQNDDDDRIQTESTANGVYVHV